jgi:hypothetical protein
MDIDRLSPSPLPLTAVVGDNLANQTNSKIQAITCLVSLFYGLLLFGTAQCSAEPLRSVGSFRTPRRCAARRHLRTVHQAPYPVGPEQARLNSRGLSVGSHPLANFHSICYPSLSSAAGRSFKASGSCADHNHCACKAARRSSINLTFCPDFRRAGIQWEEHQGGLRGSGEEMRIPNRPWRFKAGIAPAVQRLC